jgi:hypothetical protein
VLSEEEIGAASRDLAEHGFVCGLASREDAEQIVAAHPYLRLAVHSATYLRPPRTEWSVEAVMWPREA